MKKLLCLALMALPSLASLGAQGIQPCVHEARFRLAGLARLQTLSMLLRDSERTSVGQIRDQY